ncbi:hypothetical protein KDAU_20240 [Dictyobacter aurantiacus]|uniref:Uncharacterized protein n=1 Tax=Dictyobacter aurantiacus TaxID=1936993 RepID=A0A401ZCX5_9CHLR|nr:hypothetical protein KDAU_20240 [Dictyobacter aurantiacus]
MPEKLYDKNDRKTPQKPLQFMTILCWACAYQHRYIIIILLGVKIEIRHTNLNEVYVFDSRR